MGIELPAELAEVAAAAGVRWPEADEDKMRAAAAAWRGAGTRMSTLTGDADDTARTALGTISGDTAAAASTHWSAFVRPDTGHLTGTARGCVAAADRLDHAAEQIGAAKTEIIRQLIALAKNVDAAQVAAGAGQPTALLGVETTVRGTAANLANLADVLVDAVQPGGPEVKAVRDVASPDALLGGAAGLVGASAPGGADAMGLMLAGAGTPGAALGLLGAVPDTAAGLGGVVTEMVPGAVSAVTGVVPGVPEGVASAATGGVMPGVADKATGMVSGVVDATTGVVPGVASSVAGGVVPGVASAVVPGVISAATDVVPGVASSVAGGVVPGVASAVAPGVISAVAGDVVPGVAGAVAPGVVGAVADVVPGVARAMPGDVEAAADVVGGAAAGVDPVSGSGPPAYAGAIPLVLDADMPTPPTGTAIPSGDGPRAEIPGGDISSGAVPENTVHAASAAVLDAPPVAQHAQQTPLTAGGIPAQSTPMDSTRSPSPMSAGGVPSSGAGSVTSASKQGSIAREAPVGVGHESRRDRPTGSAMSRAESNGPPPAEPSAAFAAGGSAIPTPVPVVSSQDLGRSGAQPGERESTEGKRSGTQAPASEQPASAPIPVTAAREPADALFLVHMFPIGHLPVASHRPLEQVAAPPAELDYAAGMRFEPESIDDSDWIGRVRPTPGQPVAITDYDPLGGEQERDWDRRFLARPHSPYLPVEYVWPPGELYPEGGCATSEPVSLAPDTVIDRFGTPEGRVFSADGTAFPARSLPPSHVDSGYRRYRVLRPLPVWRTLSAPWFGQRGGGERYRTTHPAVELVALGYLSDITEVSDER